MVMSAPIMIRILGIGFAALFGLASPVQAHPHVWVKIRSTIVYGPHTVARFNAQSEISERPEKAVETAAAVEIRKKRGFPQAAWKAQNAFHSSHSLGGLINQKRAGQK